MKIRSAHFLFAVLLVLFAAGGVSAQTTAKKTVVNKAKVQRYLYVATPGIRHYLGYGGHGILVFDIENNHKFVKRIKTRGFREDNSGAAGNTLYRPANGAPSNVKGVAVSVPLNSIYVSTLEAVQRIDLTTNEIIWEKKYEGGADRMSISPDGRIMYLPSLEKTFWNVVDCETGNIIAPKVEVVRRAH